MNREQMRFAKRVKKRILEEPTHVVMDAYLTHIRRDHKWANLSCGTAGCIAGHCSLMAHPELSFKQCVHLDMLEEGAKNLGLSLNEAHALFMFHSGSSGAWGPYSEEHQDLRQETAGTPEYAAVVARAIDKCITRNYKGTSL